MWTQSYSKVFNNLEKEKIWSLWIDINNWHKWNPGIDYAKLEGNFEVGASFVLKPIKGPSVNIKIVEVVEGLRFTDCTTLLGAELCGTHEIIEEADGIRLTTTMKVTGMLSHLWKKLAEEIMKKVPEQTENLVNLARLKE